MSQEQSHLLIFTGAMVALLILTALAFVVRAWWTGPIVRELRGLREDLADRRKP